MSFTIALAFYLASTTRRVISSPPPPPLLSFSALLQEEASGSVPSLVSGGSLSPRPKAVHDLVPMYSVLLAINSHPVAALTHQDKMQRLKVNTEEMAAD